MSKHCGTYIPSQLLALIRSSPLLLTGKEESKKLLADEVTYVATPFLSLRLLLLGLLAFHHFHEIVITTFELFIMRPSFQVINSAFFIANLQ